jgi:uncharacterized membrane protein
MNNPVLLIVMRYLHIVSAISVVGGILFVMVCLKPAMRVLDEGLRESMMGVVRGRFHKVVIAGIIGLLISGIFNWMTAVEAYSQFKPASDALIGTKVLLALIMFAVVAARMSNIIKSDKLAQMINIHLAAIVILLAVLLRAGRLGYMF